jgi:FkbM family methyltransferase
LGAYVDIFLDRIYEKVDGFTPKPGDVVFDIGANIDFYSLMAATSVGPSGRVYAFEPNPRAFQILPSNMQANGLSCVTCFPYAVTDQSNQELHLWASEENTSTASLLHDPIRTGDATVSVPSMCLDEFVEQHGVTCIDILKMDAEGAEAIIAEGGLQRALPLTRRVVMESHNTRYAVRDLLLPLGFEMVLDHRPTHTVYFEKPGA